MIKEFAFALGVTSILGDVQSVFAIPRNGIAEDDQDKRRGVKRVHHATRDKIELRSEIRKSNISLFSPNEMSNWRKIRHYFLPLSTSIILETRRPLKEIKVARINERISRVAMRRKLKIEKIKQLQKRKAVIRKTWATRRAIRNTFLQKLMETRRTLRLNRSMRTKARIGAIQQRKNARRLEKTKELNAQIQVKKVLRARNRISPRTFFVPSLFIENQKGAGGLQKVSQRVEIQQPWLPIEQQRRDVPIEIGREVPALAVPVAPIPQPEPEVVILREEEFHNNVAQIPEVQPMLVGLEEIGREVPALAIPADPIPQPDPAAGVLREEEFHNIVENNEDQQEEYEYVILENGEGDNIPDYQPNLFQRREEADPIAPHTVVDKQFKTLRNQVKKLHKKMNYFSFNEFYSILPDEDLNFQNNRIQKLNDSLDLILLSLNILEPELGEDSFLQKGKIESLRLQVSKMQTNLNPVKRRIDHIVSQRHASKDRNLVDTLPPLLPALEETRHPTSIAGGAISGMRTENKGKRREPLRPEDISLELEREIDALVKETGLTRENILLESASGPLSLTHEELMNSLGPLAGPLFPLSTMLVKFKESSNYFSNVVLADAMQNQLKDFLIELNNHLFNIHKNFGVDSGIFAAPKIAEEDINTFEGVLKRLNVIVPEFLLFETKTLEADSPLLAPEIKKVKFYAKSITAFFKLFLKSPDKYLKDTKFNEGEGDTSF